MDTILHAVRFFPRFIVAAVLSGAAGFAAAGELWEGTIGDARVVAELDDEGRYFYRQHRKTLELRSTSGGKEHGRTWFEYTVGTTEPQARWEMQAVPEGAWSTPWEGTWFGNDGRKLPVRLTPVPDSPVADEALADVAGIDFYGHKLLSGLKFEPVRTETRGPYELEWRREPLSGVEMFQVRFGYPGGVQSINRALRTAQWEAVLGYFNCMSSARADEYEFKPTLRYMGEDAISVSRFTSYYCGGAHPDFGDSPLTLDARTGEPLQLEDVFFVVNPALPEPPAGDGSGDDKAFRDYRSKTFAPTVLGLLKSLYPQQMSPGDADGDAGADCDYTQEDYWDVPTWYLLPDGLYLGPSMPRVIRACEYPEFPVLPWSVVREHAGRIRVGPED